MFKEKTLMEEAEQELKDIRKLIKEDPEMKKNVFVRIKLVQTMHQQVLLKNKVDDTDWNDLAKLGGTDFDEDIIQKKGEQKINGEF